MNLKSIALRGRRPEGWPQLCRTRSLCGGVGNRRTRTPTLLLPVGKEHLAPGSPGSALHFRFREKAVGAAFPSPHCTGQQVEDLGGSGGAQSGPQALSAGARSGLTARRWP